jgi:hypothetical protein
MSVESFLTELGKAREEFDWILEPDASAGSERRAWTRFQIRAVPQDRDDQLLDPVGALCYMRTGELIRPEEWKRAAESLGLSSEDARRIVDAANDRTWEESNGRRRPNTDLQDLRVALIRAVERPASTISL